MSDRFNELAGRLKKITERGGQTLRWFLILSALINTLVIVGIVSLNYWLNSESGKNTLVFFIESKTGTRIQVGSLVSNLPRGGSVSDVSIQLPLVGGGFEASPSIRIKGVRVRVSMLSLLFYGTFRIKEGMIEGLEIHASRKDGVLWVAGIQDFFAKQKSEEPPTPASQEASEDAKPFSLTDLNQTMSALALPFRVKVENVGLKKAVFSFQDYVSGKLTQDLSLRSLDVLLEFTAWLRSSDLKLNVGGGDEKDRFDFSYKKFGAQKISLQRSLELRFALELEDLTKLSVKSDTKNLEEDLAFDLKLSLSDQLQLLTVERLSFALGKLLDAGLKGDVRFIEGQFKKIDINLEASAKANLSQASLYLKDFGVSTEGLFLLEGLKVHGRLEPESLSSLPSAVLPGIDLKLKTANLGVSHKLAVVKNLNSHVDVLLRQDEAAKGSGNNTKTSINAKIGVTADLAVKPMLAKGSQGLLRTPVAMNLEAVADLNRVQAAAEMTMGSILSANVNVSCAEKCGKFEAKLQNKIPSLETLMTFVTPVLSPLISSLPVLRGGSFQVDAALAGTLPPAPENTPLSARLKKAKGSVLAEVNLKDLDVVYPPANVTAEGVSLVVKASGALEKQELSVNAGLRSLSHPLLATPLENNQFQVKLVVEEMSKVAVNPLFLNVPSLGASVRAEAKAEITDNKEPSNIELKVKASLSPENMQKGLAAIEAKGTADLNLALETKDLNDVSLDGSIVFSGFSVKLPQPKEAATTTALFAIENMEGVIPFRQNVDVKEVKANVAKATVKEVVKEAGKETAKDEVVDESLEAKLSGYLDKYTDSKALADSRMKTESYLEVRPTTQKTSPVTANSISFKELAITNIEIDAELSQNMFSLNQMVFSLLGGKVQATAQVAFDSKLRQARFTSQCTEIDTRRLADSFPKLRDKMSSFSLLGSSPYIDSTLRLLYDAPSGDIAGGLEVTRIGKEQLQAMLLFVDPDETNPTIKTMRKALSVGDVRQVSVPIRNGQIGLDIDVRLFSAVPIPTPKLQRFPLAQLVRNFTSKTSAGAKDSESVKPEKVVPAKTEVESE